MSVGVERLAGRAGQSHHPGARWPDHRCARPGGARPRRRHRPVRAVVLGRHPRTATSASWRPPSSRSRSGPARDRLAAGPRSQSAAPGARVDGPGPRPRRLCRQLGAVPGHRGDRQPGPRRARRRPAHRRGHRPDARLVSRRRLVLRRRGPRVRPIHRLGHPLAPAPLGGHRWRPPAGRPRPRRGACPDVAARPAGVAAEDGAIPFMGRSLGYQFATAGPLGLAAILDELPIDPGMARGIIDRSIRYHLAHDAIDPATDWFRVGVWGARPDVCERYMSRGRIGVGRAGAGAALPARGASLLDDARPGPARDRGATHRARRRPGAPRPGIPRGSPAAGWRDMGGIGAHGPSGRHPRARLPTVLWQVAVPHATSRIPTTLPMADPDPTARMVLEGPVGDRPSGARRCRRCRRRLDLVAVPDRGRWAAATAMSAVSIRVGDAWVRAIGLRPDGPVRAVTASLPLGVADGRW